MLRFLERNGFYRF